MSMFHSTTTGRLTSFFGLLLLLLVGACEGTLVRSAPSDGAPDGDASLRTDGPEERDGSALVDAVGADARGGDASQTLPDGPRPDGPRPDTKPPQDHGTPIVCGNTKCESGETCQSCPSDCGACPPACGNTKCESGETCQSCPSDCGACPPACGNSKCEGGENCQSCPQDCGACPPALEARFNVPTASGANDLTLENTIVDFVNRTPAGQSIYLSVYHFTRSAPAQALVAAQARGVNVRVILDGSNSAYAATTTLKNGLPAANLTLCTSPNGGSCIGTDINHSKFYLFSSIGPGESSVVVQSSANLTNPMLDEHNNMVIVRGDTALYAGYLAYWQDQRAQLKNPNYYRTLIGNLPVRTYVYPRASGDTIVSVLGNVVCGGNKRLRLAMSLFTNARLAIAQSLAAKAAQGCSVVALLRDDGTTPGASVLSTLKNGGVTVHLYAASAARATIHSKYLLIDSHYDTGSGPTARKLVYSGSHNYTLGALQQNDEQLIRVDDAGVFAAFWANWQQTLAYAP